MIYFETLDHEMFAEMGREFTATAAKSNRCDKITFQVTTFKNITKRIYQMT